MHGNRRYVVYWDVLTPAQQQAREKERQAELTQQKELDARTVDRVAPGDEQNERDHKQQGEQTAAGEFGGRQWRHATDGGWFSWDVKIVADKPQELRVTYWGSDGGNRVFDVLIDGRKLATQRLEDNKPGRFYDGVYPLPAEVTKGKDKVAVRFQAHPGASAGGVFGVRVVRKE
jgi:hypothetical protein